MSPELRALLLDCIDAGVGLAVEGDRLRVQWTSGENVAIRGRLIAHKRGLLAALAERPTGAGDPRWAIALLADVDRWRAWMAAVERVLGYGIEPNQPIGWRCFVEVTA